MKKENIEPLPRSSHLRFFSKPGMLAMMESYEDPANELNIQLRNVTEEYGYHYYEAIVREKVTSRPKLVVTFKLSDNDDEIKVGNIEPILSPDEKGKTLHTSMGSLDGGVDMGNRGVMWLMKQLKHFASTQGFDVSKITSSTRYTGARAFNAGDNDDDDMPKRFDVNKKLRETVVYESSSDKVKLFVKED